MHISEGVLSAAVLGGGAALTALLSAMSLMLTGEAFLEVAQLVILAHLPVMIIEGTFTMFVFLFLAKVRPEMLGDIYGLTKVA
jgi:cobalt/nickel transport system permease protein